jgi:hypothetical protein
MPSLHHDSVTRIMSGSMSQAVQLSSFTFPTRLYAFVYITVSILLGARTPCPSPLRLLCVCWDLFWSLVVSLCPETSTFYIQSFSWGLHGGVDVKWPVGVLVLELYDLIVVRVEVSRGIVPFSPQWGSIVRPLTQSTAHWGDLHGQITFTSK